MNITGLDSLILFSLSWSIALYIVLYVSLENKSMIAKIGIFSAIITFILIGIFSIFIFFQETVNFDKNMYEKYKQNQAIELQEDCKVLYNQISMLVDYHGEEILVGKTIREHIDKCYLVHEGMMKFKGNLLGQQIEIYKFKLRDEND